MTEFSKHHEPNPEQRAGFHNRQACEYLIDEHRTCRNTLFILRDLDIGRDNNVFSAEAELAMRNFELMLDRHVAVDRAGAAEFAHALATSGDEYDRILAGRIFISPLRHAINTQQTVQGIANLKSFINIANNEQSPQGAAWFGETISETINDIHAYRQDDLMGYAHYLHLALNNPRINISFEF